MKPSVFITTITAVLLGSIAQLFLKHGVKQISGESLSFSRGGAFFTDTFSQPSIWVGVFLYGLSFLVWIIAISKVDISVAYPMLGIGFVFTALFAHYFFGESLNITKVSGIILIVFGTYLVSRSAV